MQPTINQILDLGVPSLSIKDTLSSDYKIESRSSFVHFLRWVVYFFAGKYVSPNGKLDQQVEKISRVAQDALDAGNMQDEEKSSLLQALHHVVLISERNFGQQHHLIQQLIHTHWPIAIQAADPLPTKNSLEQQVAEAKEVDQLAPTNGWKHGMGCHETEQTLEAFKTEPAAQQNIHRHHLKVVMLGDVSPRERQIIEIVSDYLQAFHGLDTTLDPTPLALYQVQTRQRPHTQYPFENHILKLQHQVLTDDAFCLGFTNQDLYPYLHADTVNFIFGVGDPDSACGLFSTYRLSTDNFELTLKRLMKLATHEFAHMRGIFHCTEHVCNMQGTNSVQESDQVPLTFCAEDMAKICHLNQWSLKKGYENQLHFFENFFQRYHQQVDFSQEIAHLKKKISKIS